MTYTLDLRYDARGWSAWNRGRLRFRGSASQVAAFVSQELHPVGDCFVHRADGTVDVCSKIRVLIDLEHH